jgi:hypothetical protein
MKATMATKAPAKTAALKKTPTAASTAVAVKKPAGNIVSIQEALKAQVAGLAGRIAPATGNTIRVSQDKKISLPDGTKVEGALNLVVVDFVTTHSFYAGRFDKDNIVPPDCFAIGTDPKNMVPSPNSPNPQAKDCQSCPMNQFGSDGKGKACKNGRRLAVLPPDANENTDMWTLNVSPTALKNFDGYVASVARTFGVPPVGVVTTVELNEAVDFPQFQFSNATPNENLEVAYNRQGEARDLLMVEPDVSNYQAPATRPAKKQARR